MVSLVEGKLNGDEYLLVSGWRVEFKCATSSHLGYWGPRRKVSCTVPNVAGTAALCVSGEWND